MADAPVGVGEVVSGRYRIDRVIGAGGMGVVVAASTSSSTSGRASSSCSRTRSSTPTSPRAFPARGARGGADQERARGARDRRGHARQRRSLHGDGVPGGEEPRGRAACSAGHCPSTRRSLTCSKRGSDRGGARRRHRSPRPQACEPVRRPTRGSARGSSRCSTSASRSRSHESAGAGGHVSSPRTGDDHRLAALHVARADARPAGRRRAHRHLVARRRSCTSCSRASRRTSVIPFLQRPLRTALLTTCRRRVPLVHGLPAGFDAVVLRALATRSRRSLPVGRGIRRRARRLCAVVARARGAGARRVLAATRGPAPSSEWPRMHPADAPTVDTSVSTLVPWGPGARGRFGAGASLRSCSPACSRWVSSLHAVHRASQSRCRQRRAASCRPRRSRSRHAR